jgi:hypothetical protein
MEKPEIKKEKDAFVECLANFLKRSPKGEFDAIIKENIKQHEPYPCILFDFVQPYAGISSILFLIGSIWKPDMARIFNLNAGTHEKAYTISINNRYHTVFADLQKIEDAIKAAFFDSWKNIESEIASLKV